ncbi:MAG: hypothetical protein GY772_25510 [bacterium]|nr:hypothetical protein [bacterium]
MGWGYWFLLSYLGVACWVALSMVLFAMPVGAGRPFRSGLLALVIMWILPALLFGALMPKGGTP